MLNLIRAEWLKIMQRRWNTLFTVFFFPLGTLLFFLFAVGVELAGLSLTQNSVDWPLFISQTFSFPGSFIGQIFLVAFAANVFAGENAWNTWKNLIPRNRRGLLILAKFAAIVWAVFLSFNLMGLVAFLGAWAISLVTGSAMDPAFGSEAAWAYPGEYVLNMLMAVASALLAAGYASIAALFTRSITGGTIIGLLIAVGEGAASVVVTIANNLLDEVDLSGVVSYLPSYSLNNIQSWLQSDEGISLSPEFVPPSLTVSLLVAMAWAVGMILLSAMVFRQRDID